MGESKNQFDNLRQSGEYTHGFREKLVYSVPDRPAGIFGLFHFCKFLQTQVPKFTHLRTHARTTLQNYSSSEVSSSFGDKNIEVQWQ